MSDTIVHIDACIACGACQNALPAVFGTGDGGDAIILAAVRADGITSANIDERSPLNLDGFAHIDAIEEAAAGCPTESIRVARVAAVIAG